MSDAWLTEQSQGGLEDPEGRPDVVAIWSQDTVLAPEVSAEQLVSTIEEVETHENDPTSEPRRDPWTTFHEEFSELGDQLKDTYRKAASDDGPSEEDIKDAFGTLASAWNQVAGSVSAALQDPEVRQRLKDAGSAFATAVGNTIAELGSELRENEMWTPTKPDNTEEE